jgi:hypothetical protein
LLEVCRALDWFGATGRIAFATGLLAVTIGYSYSYDVEFHVVIPSGTTATLILEAVDAYGMADRAVVTPTPGLAVASGVVSVCCAPDPLVTLQAYMDLNNNSVHDVGEPIDVWPGGPVMLNGNRSVQLRLSASLTPSAAVTPGLGVP